MASIQAEPRPRLDVWLWAARFFKTRSLSQQAIELGRVLVDGEKCKPSRTLRLGDRVDIMQGTTRYEVFVQGFSQKRGPAASARLLYEETRESIASRQRIQANRRLTLDPAALLHGRPTKRERRALEGFRRSGDSGVSEVPAGPGSFHPNGWEV